MIGRLLLVRHGEPDAGTRGIYGCHQGCTGLTERGREQAYRLNARLRSTDELKGAAVVLSSRLRRAVETAELAMAGLGGPQVEERCSLCELHGGAADGLSLDERESRYGLFSVIQEPDRRVAPDGESWNELIQRAGAALQAVVEDGAGSTTVVFTHTGVIAASLVALGGAEPTKLVTTAPEFTSITEWVWHDPNDVRLRSYGDAGHLPMDLRA